MVWKKINILILIFYWLKKNLVIVEVVKIEYIGERF